MSSFKKQEGILQTTLDLLQKTEEHFAFRYLPQKKIDINENGSFCKKTALFFAEKIAFFKRIAIIPFIFFLIGLKELFRIFHRWRLFFLACAMIFTFSLAFFQKNIPLLTSSGALSVLSDALPILIIATSLFLVIFAAPSTYTLKNITEQDVYFVRNYILEINDSFVYPEMLRAIRENIAICKEQAFLRTKRIRYAWISLYGAFCTFYFSNNGGNNKIFLIFTILFLLLFFLCAYGYDATIQKLFHTIELGFNEALHHTEKKLRVQQNNVSI